MSFKPYLDQDYNSIRQNCLASGKLFEDEKFLANETSLARFKPAENVNWKRPSQFCKKNPEFIVNQIEPNDLDQGGIGDCWLISAAAVVASVPEYADIIIPSDQSFQDNYAGIFRFRFWRFGEWIEVVVDDRLPVDENDNLIYCHNSKDTNEMFAPLLEKAFAKLATCYEFLDGGDAVEAMIDMTGGVHERFKIKPQKADNNEQPMSKKKLWEVIFKAFTMKSLCGASIDVTDNKSQEHVEANGLVLGHAYCVLNVFELIENNGQYNELRSTLDENPQTKSIKLLKMRNPWGETKSYSGRWSSSSREWDQVSQDIKDQLNIKDQTDGQFFICYDDFVTNFDDFDMVHVNLNAFQGQSELTGSFVKWINKQFTGSWKAGVNAGGCGNEKFEDFWLNPQYFVSLTLQNSQDELVSAIISLMQTEQNRKRAETDGTYESSNEAINFAVYKIKDGVESKKKYKYSDVDEIYSYPTYMCQREITARLDLQPGNYIIIPSTFEKDKHMNFLLRVAIEGQESTDISLKAVDLNKLKKHIVPVNIEVIAVENPEELQEENVNEEEYYYEEEEEGDYEEDEPYEKEEEAHEEEAHEEGAYEEEEQEENDEEGNKCGNKKKDQRNKNKDHHRKDKKDDDGDRQRKHDDREEEYEDGHHARDRQDRDKNRDREDRDMKDDDKRDKSRDRRRDDRDDDRNDHHREDIDGDDDDKRDKSRDRRRDDRDRGRKDEKDDRRNRRKDDRRRNRRRDDKEEADEPIPEEYSRRRRNYERQENKNKIDPSGQVISRACLVM